MATAQQPTHVQSCRPTRGLSDAAVESRDSRKALLEPHRHEGRVTQGMGLGRAHPWHKGFPGPALVDSPHPCCLASALAQTWGLTFLPLLLGLTKHFSDVPGTRGLPKALPWSCPQHRVGKEGDEMQLQP